MEGCSKMAAGAASGLPEGPLVDILSRLPAKSVCRFKCVSKGWCDLINDPAIRKKLRQAMQGLFVQAGYVEVDEVTRVSLIDMTARSVPFSFSFLPEMTGIRAFFLQDSCNGLVLFGHQQEPNHVSASDYFVCNPTTKGWLGVPACDSREMLSHTYLAFDPAVSSHFHLVQFQMPEVHMKVVSLHVYSSETGTWSQNRLEGQIDGLNEQGLMQFINPFEWLLAGQIDGQNEQGQLEGQVDEQNEQGQLEGWHNQFTLSVRDYHCAFVNGLLHLIVWGAHRQRQHILVFNIQGKARRIITVPGSQSAHYLDQSQGHLRCVTIKQSQGHLHCVTINTADKINDILSIWVLQDYDREEWVLKRTVNSLDIFGETEFRPQYFVVDIHQDCNVLFFYHQLVNKLIAYDMDRKEVNVLATFQDDKCGDDFARYVPYYLESPALTNNQ